MAMESNCPVLVNRAHRHFIIDDEIVTSLPPSRSSQSTPHHNNIDPVTATFTNFPSPSGQSRIRTPSIASREATESTAIRKALLESRRHITKKSSTTSPRQPSSINALTLIPQEIKDSNSICHIDPSVSLVDIPLEELALLVQYRPTRIFQPRNVARNIKRIVQKITLQLQALHERDLLKSNESTTLLKKIFLVHFICLGYHIDSFKTPFVISTDLLENDNWSSYTVGCFRQRRGQATTLNAGEREALRLHRCGQLIKQVFISKAASCLMEKVIPIPKNSDNKERLKTLQPPDQQRLGDLREDGSITDIILDQSKINSIPKRTIDPIVVSRHIRIMKRMKSPSGTTSTRNEHLQELITGPKGDIGLTDLTWIVEACLNREFPDPIYMFLSYGELTGISKIHDPDGIRPITMCETLRHLCFSVVVDLHKLDCIRLFENTNFAVNGPNGIDKLNHLRESMERRPGFDTLILDAKATYQNFNRKEALREILEHVPGMFNFFYAIYLQRTSVWLAMDDSSVHEILSELGGHQGCTTATLLHAFGTRQATIQLQAKMTRQGEFIAPYSDNTNGRGSHQSCIEVLRTMRRIGPAYGIHLGTVKVLIGSSGGHENSNHRRRHYLDLGVQNEDIIFTHPDDMPTPSISRLGRQRTQSKLDRLRTVKAARYGFQVLGIPLGLPEFISKSIKDKFTGLHGHWKPILKYKDTQAVWLMLSMCLSKSISYMCRQIPTVYIEEHATIFDDTLRLGIRKILSTSISDLEWTRLKLPMNMGGAGLFNVHDTSKAAFVASYQECFQHTSKYFPDITDMLYANDRNDPRMTTSIKSYTDQRTQLICQANELNLPTHCPEAEREQIKLQYSLSKVLSTLSFENFIVLIRGRGDFEANLLHTRNEESFVFLKTIPYKKTLTLNPDRFKTAFKIRFKLPLTFGSNFICKCGFICREESDTHTLRCPRYGNNYMCHNAVLQFVESLARDAGFHAPKGDVCMRESSTGVCALRADGIILLADEDCSKDMIIDTFGVDPTLVSLQCL